MYIVTLKNIDTGQTKTVHDLLLNDNTKIIPNGKITKAVNEISSFVFDIYPNNIGFNYIETYKTFVEVYNTKKKKYEFKGRVLIPEITMDSDGMLQKTVTCESKMGFLQDVRCPEIPEKTYTLDEFIELLLNWYNSRVESYKKIYKGTINVQTFESTNNVTKALDSQQTILEALENKLIESFGGEIEVIEDEQGILFLNYIQQLGKTDSKATIEVTKNMITAKKEIDPTEVVSRLNLYGAKKTEIIIDENGYEQEVETGERVTIDEINDGKIYLEDTDAMQKYGVQESTLIYDDVELPENLKSKGEQFLLSNNKVQEKHTISYANLYVLGKEKEDIEIYNTYLVKNNLMNIEDNLRVIKQTIDIINIDTSSITVGDIFKTLTEIEADRQKQLNSTIRTIEIIQKNYTTNLDIKNATNELKTYINEEVGKVSAGVEEIKNLTDFIKSINSTQYLLLENTAVSKGMIYDLRIRGFKEMPLYSNIAFASNHTQSSIHTIYCINQDISLEKTENLVKTYILLDEPLRTLELEDGTVIYDEIVISNNKIYIYRNIGLDENNNLVQISTDVKFYGNTQLTTFAGQTYIFLDYFTDLLFESTYMIANEFTNTFATQLESSSSIELLKDNILLLVTKDSEIESSIRILQENISLLVTKDGVISAINLSPEKIKILAKNINLEGIVTANGYFRILEDGSMEAVNGSFSGNVYLSKGGKVIGGDGLFTNLQFQSAMDYEYLGYEADNLSEENKKTKIDIECLIPQNFTVVGASITLFHKPAIYIDTNNVSRWGYSRNIRLYKNESLDNSYRTVYFGSEYYEDDGANYTEITNALGTNGFTASIPSYENHKVEEVTTIDISSKIKTGRNQFVLQTADKIPDYIAGDTPVNNWIAITQKTGLAYAILNVYGYMSVQEGEV